MIDHYKVPLGDGRTAPMPQPTIAPADGGITSPLPPPAVPPPPEPSSPIPNTSPLPSRPDDFITAPTRERR